MSTFISIDRVQPKIECPYCLEGDTGVQRTMNMQEVQIFGILTCYNWPHYYAYCAANPTANHDVEECAARVADVNVTTE